MKDLNDDKLSGAYYDHYEKYLGKPVDYLVFSDRQLGRKILVLIFSNVFTGCVTFATIGLSFFSKNVQECGELVCVVDAAEEYIPDLLFNTVRTLVINKIKLGWGTGITCGENKFTELVKATNKNSVYITDPLPFPEPFSHLDVDLDLVEPRVYLCILISKNEYALFCSHGAKEFELYLEKNNIDPFNVMRR